MKNKIKKMGKLVLILAFNLVIFSNLVLAQVSINPEYKPEYAPEFKNQVVKDGAHNYINFILQVFAGGLIYIAGPLAVLMLVWGGSSYISARGDQGAVDKAKKTIIYAIAGLIVIILSYSLVSNIIAIVGTGVQS